MDENTEETTEKHIVYLMNLELEFPKWKECGHP